MNHASVEFDTLVQTARTAYSAGISVLPPAQDGTKAPTTILVNGENTWAPFQHHAASLHQVSQWYERGRRTGLGYVCGKVSNCLEVLDFDHRGTYEKFKESAIAVGLGTLVEKIEAGYLENSPGDGVHWLYYCTEVRPSTKLARRLKTPNEFLQKDEDAVEQARLNGKTHKPIKVLIETKGEGGFIVVAPSFGSVHPSGNPYKLLRGGVEQIVSIGSEERQALWWLAKTFDELSVLPKPEKPPNNSWDDDDGVPPWEDFNARASWDEILAPHGWVKLYTRGDTTYWRRPGKTSGISATTGHNGLDIFYVFTSSTIFDSNKSYDKVGAYVRLNHNNDFGDCARHLRKLGYGDQKVEIGSDGKIHRAGTKPQSPSVSAIDPNQKPPRVAQNVVLDDFSLISNEDMGIVPLSSVECRPVRWLWKYRLSRGGMALMAGDGGIGKSQVLLWIGSMVTLGAPWIDGSGNAPLGDVIIVSAEDRPDDTIKPRLLAMGANIERITIVRAKYIIRRPGKPPLVNPASFQDIPYWREVFKRRPNCTLFIADPVPSYLGRGVNDSKNIEIRNILEPFIDEVIAPADICMIGNTHLNKTADAKTPMHRISGSIAYGALPRNVHFVVRDPDDPLRRYFKQAKCNNAPDDLAGLAFRIERREVINADGEVIETSVPVFEVEGVECDLGNAMNGTGPSNRHGPEPKKTMALAEWLFDFLMKRRSNPTPLAEIFNAAGDADLVGRRKDDGRWSSGSMLYQARDRVCELPAPRDKLEVVEMMKTSRVGGKEYVHWYLSPIGGEPEDPTRGEGEDGIF